MIWKPTHPILWQILFPIRLGVKKNPTAYLSGVAVRFLLKPFIPKKGTYTIDLPTNGKINLRYDDSIGLSTILHGFFEEQELRYTCSQIKDSDTVIDVGAHIGLFTVTMAKAVGPRGKVLSIEPIQTNIDQLSNNLALNEIRNVSIIASAAGDQNKTTTLHVADDLAFSTLNTPWAGHISTKTISVPLKTLDHIWENIGSPAISFIKIDVEGVELSVLKGATKLLTTHKPVLLIEANEQKNLESLIKELSPFGYVMEQPPQFAKWNYIFRHKM